MPSPWGKLNLYGNVTVLDAEFTKGSPGAFVEGNTAAYAPDYQFKTGAIFDWKEAVKISMLGTIVDDHFSNADNGFQHFIPAYNIWDPTAEVKFWNNRVGVFAGIKNLFDERLLGGNPRRRDRARLSAQLLRRCGDFLLSGSAVSLMCWNTHVGLRVRAREAWG
jgi:outer membrane receptor protein involved in Fe transport